MADRGGRVRNKYKLFKNIKGKIFFSFNVIIVITVIVGMIFMNFNPEGGADSNSTFLFIGKELISGAINSGFFGLIIAYFVDAVAYINEKENEAKDNNYR